MEVGIFLVRDNVAACVASFAHGLDRSVHDRPWSGEGISVEVTPTVQGPAVEKQLPPVGFFLRSEYVMLRRATNSQEHRNKRGSQPNDHLFHINRVKIRYPSDSQKPNYEEKQDYEQYDRDYDAPASYFYSPFSTFSESFVPFSAAGEQQADQAADQRADKNEFQHSEQI
jgi:hypothetical protein